jgi:hypothetical protein
MARESNAEDRFIWDYTNNKLIIAIDDANRLEIDKEGVVVPGNLTVSGSISPLSGVFGTFFVNDVLNVSGSIRNPVGTLILNDTTFISGTLATNNTISAAGQVSASAFVADNVTATVTASVGDLNATGDINAIGGFANSLILTSGPVEQNKSTKMTGSVVGTVTFLGIPTSRPGSILSYIVKCGPNHCIKSGSVSASLTLNGANIANTTMLLTTGSLGSATYNYKTTSKDTWQFVQADMLGISLTGSATYLCEPDITSASFIANITIEY